MGDVCMYCGGFRNGPHFANCPRTRGRITRRKFFFLASAAIALPLVPKLLLPASPGFEEFDNWIPKVVPACLQVTLPNQWVRLISAEALRILHSQIKFVGKVNKEYSYEFSRNVFIRNDSVDCGRVRLPSDDGVQLLQLGHVSEV